LIYALVINKYKQEANGVVGHNYDDIRQAYRPSASHSCFQSNVMS